jgi:rhodanese-related sulfurtransferase
MNNSKNDIARITPQQLEAKLRGKERVALLDVRRVEAWASDPAHIPGAVWVPLEEVPQRARDLPTDAELVIYCS